MDLGIVADRSVAQDWALGHLRTDGGEWDALVALRHRPAATARQGGSELFLEVAVEETVDDGVDAGGGHGREVAEWEDGVVATRRDCLVVPVKHRVKDIEGEPRDGERHHDGEQHDVDPGGAFVFLVSGPATLHHVLPPPEAQVNVQVADHDEGQWKEVLKDKQEGGVGLSFLNRWPSLHTNEVVIDWQGRAEVLERQGEHTVREERHRDKAGHDPDDNHGQVRLAHHGLPPGRVDNELVALQGDEDEGEDGDGDWYTLDEGRELAENFSQDPVVHQGVDDSDRQANHAHQDVGAGQVGDEDVGDVAHLLVPRDDKHQARVPDETHCHNCAVSNDEKSGAAHGERAVLGEVPRYLFPQGMVVIGVVLQLHGAFPVLASKGQLY